MSINQLIAARAVQGGHPGSEVWHHQRIFAKDQRGNLPGQAGDHYGDWASSALAGRTCLLASGVFLNLPLAKPLPLSVFGTCRKAGQRRARPYGPVRAATITLEDWFMV